MSDTQYTTQLMPHKVLSNAGAGGLPVGLTFTENQFAGIVFRYTNVSFEEIVEEDKLMINFEYDVLDVPESLHGYDKPTFEKILGEFVIQLLYYGLERDHLGFIDNENRNNHPV